HQNWWSFCLIPTKTGGVSAPSPPKLVEFLPHSHQTWWKLSASLCNHMAFFTVFAASIAFHIADSRNVRDENYDSMKVSKITDEILRIIMLAAGRDAIDNSSSNYHRLLTHIKFFSERLITDTQLQGQDRVMYEHVLNSYPNSTKVAIKVLEYLDKNYHYTVTSEELMYLIIHIHRNIHRNI
ncbi:PRD domain-containing protein, partial [Ligilactobacillus sp.]|uniref:PRD domain-containing protein n=1 Tax=Ligilactobacillus sp. TaxID=2767921 RepID=UPI002FE1D63D